MLLFLSSVKLKDRYIASIKYINYCDSKLFGNVIFLTLTIIYKEKSVDGMLESCLEVFIRKVIISIKQKFDWEVHWSNVIYKISSFYPDPLKYLLDQFLPDGRMS